METPHRHQQPRARIAARASRALSAASHRGRHRAARPRRARNPPQLARVRCLRQPLGERARGARRRAWRSRRHGARQFARAPRDLLGVREARRRRRAAVAAADRDRPRLAARRRAARASCWPSSDQLRDAGRGATRGVPSTPAWVLIDAAADDEAAGYRAYGLAARRRQRRGAGCARRGGRPADADVHVGHDGLAERHPAHALHPRDVRDDDGERVADGAGIGRAALGRDRLQRRDGDDVPGVHAGRDVRAAPRVRRRGVHRHRRARARHAHDAGARRRSSRSSTPRASIPSRLTSLEMVLSLGAPLH